MNAKQARIESAKHVDIDKLVEEHLDEYCLPDAINAGKYECYCRFDNCPDGMDWNDFAKKCHHALNMLGFEVEIPEKRNSITTFKIKW